MRAHFQMKKNNTKTKKKKKPQRYKHGGVPSMKKKQ
jgi:hypothetical protein|tara:strand:- start:261 stop:368 length:108 start_codon:yes stop_codon:yes gene_type:complete